MPKWKDITGQRYGKLVVKEFLYTDKKTSYWKCVCDCGNEIITTHQKLINTKGKRSCGCLKLEKLAKTLELVHELNKKPSKITIKGDYAEIELSNCDKVALVDTEDVPKIKDFCWYLDDSGYPRANDKSSGKYKQKRLHKLIITDIGNDMVIDHISQNKLDNRKSNLRVVTTLENANNNYKTEPKNSLKVKYIYYRKNYNDYTVRYTRYGKDYYVGCYHSIEEAKEKLKEHLIKNNFKELINE